MRLPRVVASVTLIVALVLVAVPQPVGSQTPTRDSPIDPALFQTLELSRSSVGTTTATPTLDPANRADGTIGAGSTMLEPAAVPPPTGRAVVPAATAPRGVIVIPTWHTDPNVSWYGPGFYGHRTACGYALTTSLVGVAHKTLPCGTLVKFRNPANGVTVTMPVVDRGPYVAGRQWDLTGGACLALVHCYTGPIEWRLP
ncbi:MAG TPA: septal ring lytic transglycosylase RlpA family protein [Candidatus Limnocylindrales bacterium]|nr:septal ring lytic transglycosylase RlpA family protein [Candidatus Limnocylindrales bacterium]